MPQLIASTMAMNTMLSSSLRPFLGVHADPIRPQGNCIVDPSACCRHGGPMEFTLKGPPARRAAGRR